MTLRTRPRELEVKDWKFIFSEKAREGSRKRPTLNILRKSIYNAKEKQEGAQVGTKATGRILGTGTLMVSWQRVVQSR